MEVPRRLVRTQKKLEFTLRLRSRTTLRFKNDLQIRLVLEVIESMPGISRFLSGAIVSKCEERPHAIQLGLP